VPPIPRFEDEIVAIPTVDDVIARSSDNLPFVAGSPVDDIIASGRAIIASQEGVVARPAVDDVVACSCEDEVPTAEATYLVVAVLTGQLVRFVGA
jgi:hypothetical protein